MRANSVFRLLLATVLVSLCLPAHSAPGRKKKSRPAGPSITWVNELPADKTLPPNTRHLTFESKAAGREVGYCLYLPPDYAKNPDKRYPVIYNLHGNGGNEFTGLFDIEVLHEGIVAGKWPPMIMVLPNGGRSTFYKDSHDGKFPIETMFIREFIPHIDKTCRTIAERRGRAIEGFSMGGRGSTRLAMKYPELFCSLFCQAGNVPRTSEKYDPAAWKEYLAGYLGPDRRNYIDNDAFLLAKKNRGRIVGGLRIQIACGTKDGGHLPTVRDFHQHLVDLMIDHTYIELEDLAHRRTEMINRLRPVWFDYHVESFRLAGDGGKKRAN
jgi:enterochelin esterase-like enzyme